MLYLLYCFLAGALAAFMQISDSSYFWGSKFGNWNARFWYRPARTSEFNAYNIARFIQFFLFFGAFITFPANWVMGLICYVMFGLLGYVIFRYKIFA